MLLDLGPVQLRGYAMLVLLGMGLAWAVKRHESARLGHRRWPGYAWVQAGALLGAVLGAKLGMVLFETGPDLAASFTRMLALDFTGRTVIGGIAGGYLGVELAKRAVGITQSTGDAFAVALPLAQGIGRIGCFLEGCCYGAAWEGPWAVDLLGAPRHPAQLYEAGLDLGLAAALWALRGRTRVPGHLFKGCLAGYATIRFVCEFFRGDPHVLWGPLTAAQWVCLAAAAGFGLVIALDSRRNATASAP